MKHKLILVLIVLAALTISVAGAQAAQSKQTKAHVSCWIPVYTYACYYGPWSNYQLECDWVYDHSIYVC